MTTQRSPRSVLSLTASLLLVALAAAAFALDEAQFRPQVEQFLADEALPEVELNDRLRTNSADRWPDAGCLAVGLNTHRTPSFVHQAILDDATGAVVGFIGAQPEPPVPMSEMPAEEAVEIARAFAGRHLPELFADGGEVAVTVADGITPLGARMVNLQRTVQGVQVPTFADVGVRVYDGKVVYWRRHDVPLAEGLQLPGTVDLEQAKQIASENVPYKDHAPVFWFDETHKVLVTDDGQRNAWELWAAIKLPTTPENRLEFFAHWQIGANSGEVLLSEGIDPGKSVDLLTRYYVAGGEHSRPNSERPQPDVMVEDRQPIFAPDGSLLFLSDRPREGYPAWLRHSGGLFAMNTDGSELRCVSAAHEGEMPQFSPDGSRMLVKDAAGIHVIPRHGGDELLIDSQGGEMGYLHVGWLNDSTLLVDVGSGFGAAQLMTADLTEAQPTLQPTGLTGNTSEFFTNFLPMPDGTLVYCFYGYRGNNEWDLMRVDLSAETPEPQVIADDPKIGGPLRLMEDGRVLIVRSKDAEMNPPGFLVDPATGEVERWEIPPMEMPGTEGKRRLTPRHVRLSSDGQRIVFAAKIEDLSREKPPAVLSFTANADGSDVRQVTPWESAVVPMVE